MPWPSSNLCHSLPDCYHSSPKGSLVSQVNPTHPPTQPLLHWQNGHPKRRMLACALPTYWRLVLFCVLPTCRIMAIATPYSTRVPLRGPCQSSLPHLLQISVHFPHLSTMPCPSLCTHAVPWARNVLPRPPPTNLHLPVHDSAPGWLPRQRVCAPPPTPGIQPTGGLPPL